ncbi:hypothetical protein SOVF_066050 [Spinacia oleracea]|uniref:Transcription factor SRM1-like n=1 Tax=Spinacia oleracea TaxID=3562 RepID=A0A9R0ID05_SPIOL|nr:transcription factor SRM1-like [Spinacia oleracea]KNA18949.1 hypothetical protein SOVF_066050 [Spinacia oleracea]
MANSRSTWTWQQNKAFEVAVAIYSEDHSEEKWGKIASEIPGYKTIEEIKHHYQLLVGDVEAIESGLVPLPPYTAATTAPHFADHKFMWEFRKGQPWSENEHKQFLLGLHKYGKGDWKSISMEFVRTRSASQVASHAQKYFKRQTDKKKKKKDRKRWSIFDITAPVDQGGSQNRGSSSLSSKNDDHTRKGKETEPAVINEVTFEEKDPMIAPAEYVLPQDSWSFEDDPSIDFYAIDECLSQLPPL